MKVYKEQAYFQSLIIQYDLIKTFFLTQNNSNSLPTHTQTQIFLVFIDN